MGIRDAVRSILLWFSGGPNSVSDSASEPPKSAPGPAFETACSLSAANDYELGAALKRLAPGECGYITAEDYEEITAEELNELSVAGREIIANVAAGVRCTSDYRPGERRVYFTKHLT